MKDKSVILVVDDQPKNTELLEALLVPKGYEVVKAVSGVEALTILSDNQIDLVLLDVIMPGMSGLEVLEKIRADKKTRLIPVVMVTVLKEIEDRIKALEAGCDDFISKPFDRHELLARVKSLLRIKSLHDEVEEAHKFAENVINTVQESLIVLDQNLRVVTVSRSFYDFFKVKPEETVGQLIYDLGNKQWDIPKLRELLETILPEKTSFDNYEVEHDFATIGRHIMLLNARRIERRGGEELIILLAIEDITERKQAEEALRESEEKYRTVADFTYNMETWRMPDGTFRYVSPSCERITGYTAAEFLATPDLLIKITHPDDQSKVIEHYLLDHQGAGTENRGIDFRILTPGGDIRWLGHSCTAVHGREGKYLGRRESNREITKRKKAEEEKEKLEVQNRQLQKTESLGRLAGSIAHHFNNNLSVVIGNLELVLNDLPGDAKERKNLLNSMMAAQKAAAVSRQMLSYLGQTSCKREPINLSKSCRSSLSLLQAAIPKGMILNVDFPDSGPVIRSNAGLIQQVLTNLIINAWESISDNQGTIGLTIKTVAYEDISTSWSIPFDWQPQHLPLACIEVSDTGCGISNKDIEKLFEPFFTTNFTGRGMGLPVALGIVKSHGGCITVDSEPGCGSIFRIYLPISTEIISR